MKFGITFTLPAQCHREPLEVAVYPQEGGRPLEANAEPSRLFFFWRSYDDELCDYNRDAQQV